MSEPNELPGRRVPHGVEVLVTKAAVDPAFRTLLLERRAEAAEEIELELTPAEVALLDAVPRAQLEAIIDQTIVPPEQRQTFLDAAAAVRRASAGFTGHSFGGIRPDDPAPDADASE